MTRRKIKSNEAGVRIHCFPLKVMDGFHFWLPKPKTLAGVLSDFSSSDRNHTPAAAAARCIRCLSHLVFAFQFERAPDAFCLLVHFSERHRAARNTLGMLEKLEVHAGTCTHIRGAPLHCLLGPGKNNQKFSKLGYRRGERVVKVGWRAVHFLNSPAGVAALPALPIGANVDVEAAARGGGLPPTTWQLTRCSTRFASKENTLFGNL